MFEYMNGFRKTIYWTKQKMEAHALKYSKGYKAKKGYTFWEKDFDGMAYKTMLRQLISKWGIMSVDMQTAMEKDMAVIKENGDYEYIDNNSNEIDVVSNEKSNEEKVEIQENVNDKKEEYEDPFLN